MKKNNMLHTIALACLAWMMTMRWGSPVYAAANASGTEGTHVNPVSYTAGDNSGTDIFRGAVVALETPADGHDRKVVLYPGAAGSPPSLLGVAAPMGSSAEGEPVPIYVPGLGGGSVPVAIDPTASDPVPRGAQLVPSTNPGYAVAAGDDNATAGTAVIGYALEADDLNDIIEAAPAAFGESNA